MGSASTASAMCDESAASSEGANSEEAVSSATPVSACKQATSLPPLPEKVELTNGACDGCVADSEATAQLLPGSAGLRLVYFPPRIGATVLGALSTATPPSDFAAPFRSESTAASSSSPWCVWRYCFADCRMLRYSGPSVPTAVP